VKVKGGEQPRPKVLPRGTVLSTRSFLTQPSKLELTPARRKRRGVGPEVVECLGGGKRGGVSHRKKKAEW